MLFGFEYLSTAPTKRLVLVDVFVFSHVGQRGTKEEGKESLVYIELASLTFATVSVSYLITSFYCRERKSDEEEI